MKQFSCALVSAFALLATASPVPATHFEISNGSTVTAADVSTLKFFSQYAGASYCNSEVDLGSTVTCAENTCPDVTSAGAKVVATFSGHLTDIQGFVSSDDTNELIVASVRGSHSIRNWIADLSFIPLPCDLVDDCLIHTGFLLSWKEIEDDLLDGVAAAKEANPSYKIIFTGHSLGGAVATVAAGYARDQGYELDLYTYGSPRVGNQAFVDFVTAQPGGEFRVTHLDDPVPRLPPIAVDYRHTSPEYWLSGESDNSTLYAASDIKVCEGFANTDCNGGTGGLDIPAHLLYFEHISGCGPDGIAFKRRGGQRDVSDEELLAKLSDWTAQDREIAATLKQ
ncbi:Mono- and diacylglycerol lipase [Daldinia childiae]|uniref:Mono- and diacylglycerol lipase n=1 Tax=Daldinia childiae TaxID=326645 RepID=UPI001447ECCA|nr:Mono- and diacylglycerol lipase [Daldinia childiae]KAF3056271.1 Mono- and diacylglycerol lipase [Daldinia childiae]